LFVFVPDRVRVPGRRPGRSWCTWRAALGPSTVRAGLESWWLAHRAIRRWHGGSAD